MNAPLTPAWCDCVIEAVFVNFRIETRPSAPFACSGTSD